MVVGLESSNVIVVFTPRLLRDETFGVFRQDFFGDLHAMVADEVVNHFQLVKKRFFIESLTPEVEADCVQNFFLLNPGEVCPLRFFVVFFEACHTFDDKPESC